MLIDEIDVIFRKGKTCHHPFDFLKMDPVIPIHAHNHFARITVR